MKKLLALFLAALMIFTLFACSDEEEDEKDNLDDYEQDDIVIDHITDENGNTFYFDSVDSESVTITKYEGSDQPHALEIPEKLNGKTVVAISSQAFYFCSNITSLTFSAPITSIGDYAFAGCSMLNALVLPASVSSIGDAAFYGCSSLETLTFATTSELTAIPYAAFRGCTSLKAVTVPAYINTIAQGAFEGCEALATVTIQNGVEVIGTQAFQNCTALASLTLPESVVSIGKYAFSGSEKLYLDGITVPAGSYAETFINDMKLDQSAPAETPAA